MGIYDNESVCATVSVRVCDMSSGGGGGGGGGGGWGKNPMTCSWPCQDPYCITHTENHSRQPHAHKVRKGKLSGLE